MTPNKPMCLLFTKLGNIAFKLHKVSYENAVKAQRDDECALVSFLTAKK